HLPSNYDSHRPRSLSVDGLPSLDYLQCQRSSIPVASPNRRHGQSLSVFPSLLRASLASDRAVSPRRAVSSPTAARLQRYATNLVARVPGMWTRVCVASPAAFQDRALDSPVTHSTARTTNATSPVAFQKEKNSPRQRAWSAHRMRAGTR